MSVPEDAVRLPDGRQLRLGADLRGVMNTGVLVCDGVRIGPGDSVAPEIEALAERSRDRWTGLKPSEIEGLGEARRLYRSVGMEPTRYRPSSEALLRRLLKGKSLYAINNAVDCCNLACVSFLLPIGLYDLDRIEADVTLRLGRPDEQYAGIRKGAVHLEGRLGLFDAKGPFGSPTSDSSRTMVREETTRLLAVIMATGACPGAKMLDHVGLLSSLLQRHCGATETLAALVPRMEELP